MSEMHLRQPGFTFSACGPFTKNKERILKFTEKGDWRYIYQKELHKVAFNMTKDLPRRTASDETLCDKTFLFVKNPK